MIREAIVDVKGALHGDGDGTIVEIEAVLKSYYQKWKCDPCEIRVDSLEEATVACLSLESTTKFTAMEEVPYVSSWRVSGYRSRFTLKVIKISELPKGSLTDPAKQPTRGLITP